MDTATALRLAAKAQLVLDAIGEMDDRPAWEVQAENRLNRKLQRLFADVGQETVRQVLEANAIPAHITAQAGLIARLRVIEPEYADLLLEASLDAATHGRRGVLANINRQPGTRIHFSDFSPFVRELIEQHAFAASAFTFDRIIGDVMGTLTQAYVDGLGIQEAAVRLRAEFDGLHDWQLRRIARTEINAAQSVGSFETMRELRVSYHMWLTARDARVRDSHTQLQGVIVRVGDEFPNGLRHPGDRSGDPSEYVNCFPAGTLTTASKVEAATQRLYQGELVRIKTARGYELTGTPNHPILTDRGWVTLGALVEGDDVFSSVALDSLVRANPDEYQGPAMIEEIYRALASTGSQQRVRGSMVNFHGDRGNGEVDIVRAGRSLWNDCHPGLHQPFSQDLLVGADVLTRSLMHLGSQQQLAFSALLSAHGIMSSARQFAALISREALHPELVGLGASSRLQAGFPHVAIDDITRNTIAASQRQDRSAGEEFGDNGRWQRFAPVRFGLTNGDAGVSETLDDRAVLDATIASDGRGGLASLVTLDHVTEVSRREVKSPIHVYNLQTRDGWYVANGIVSHNCRCRTRPFIMPRGRIAPPGRDWFREGDLVKIAA